jgi:hypothetical protein
MCLSGAENSAPALRAERVACMLAEETARNTPSLIARGLIARSLIARSLIARLSVASVSVADTFTSVA